LDATSRVVGQAKRFSEEIVQGVAATRGFIGMDRWVGLGVIADNIINIGRAMEKQPDP
jgi:hypothetical protein